MFDVKYFVASCINRGALNNSTMLTFRSNDLNLAAQSLIDSLVITAPTSDQAEEDYTIALSYAIEAAFNTDTGRRALDVLQSVGVNIADQIENSMLDISETIRPTVQSLASEITARKDEYIIRNYGVVEGHEGTSPTVSFSDFHWGRSATPSYVKILEDDAKNLNKGNVYARRDIPGLADRSVAEIYKIQNIDTQVGDISGAVTKLHEIFGGKYSSDQILAKLLWVITPRDGFAAFARGLQTKINNHLFVEFTKSLVLETEDFEDIMVTLSDKREELPLNGDVVNLLIDNFTKLTPIIRGFEQILMLVRREILADVLLIDRNTINRAVYDAYLSGGHTEEELSDFVSLAGMRDITLSLVHDKDIINARDHVSTEIASLRRQASSNRAAINGRAYQVAIESVLKAYATTMMENTQNPEESQRLLSVHSAKIMNISSFDNREDALEDFLYDYVIQMSHGDGILYTLYRRMSSGFVDMVKETSGDVTDATIRQVNRKAIASIVMEFMLKSMCELKK